MTCDVPSVVMFIFVRVIFEGIPFTTISTAVFIDPLPLDVHLLNSVSASDKCSFAASVTCNTAPLPLCLRMLWNPQLSVAALSPSSTVIDSMLRLCREASERRGDELRMTDEKETPWRVSDPVGTEMSEEERGLDEGTQVKSIFVIVVGELNVKTGLRYPVVGLETGLERRNGDR